MFKLFSLALGLNLLGFITIFQDSEVKVRQIAPLTLAPGESYEVKVNFNKSTVSGFAKFEVEVDEDLEVSVGNIGSASFSFENGIAKFIWFALPEESNFSISYFLKNNDETIGNEKNVYAQFSYLDENTKKVFDLPDHQLMIETYTNDSIVSNENIIATNIPPVLATLSEQEKLNAIREHIVILERDFERLDNGLYRMNITVNKGPIEGFAKLEEIVPDGFEYQEESTSGAIFTKINGKAKFVWFDLPDQDLIDISYNLTADEANVIGLHNITGEFTYIIDDQDIKSKTVPAFFQISTSDMVNILEDRDLSKEEEVVEELSNNLWQEENVNENNTVATSTENTNENPNNAGKVKTWQNDMVGKSDEEKEKQEMAGGLDEGSKLLTEDETEGSSVDALVSNENDQDQELIENVTGIAPASEGVNYRIQICATKKVAEKNYFKKHKNFNLDIILENHEGWIKYTTGKYPFYKQARTIRSVIDKNYDLDGPFVAAYNYGERITVQEALMISDQKWFK